MAVRSALCVAGPARWRWMRTSCSGTACQPARRISRSHVSRTELWRRMLGPCAQVNTWDPCRSSMCAQRVPACVT
eukprot:1322649-Amphidinium_carterae.1